VRQCMRPWAVTADVLDLLASEFGAQIGVDCLSGAATWGHDAMIDHLVEEYGVDPNGVDQWGWTALHKAAKVGPRPHRQAPGREAQRRHSQEE
jgi:hypothetical protein